MGREHLKEKEQSRKKLLTFPFDDFNFDYVLGLYRLTLYPWMKKEKILKRWHKLLWNFPGYTGTCRTGKESGRR